MALTDEANTRVSQSRLLQLPGEIRNRIYAHVTQQTTVPLSPPPYSLPKFQRAPARTSNWSKFQRQSLGLTQACRQIRKEFLPLHQRSIFVELLPRHVETYVAEFFPGDNAHGVVYIWTYEDTSISVLPLLRLHARFPDLDLRFDCEEVEDWRILKGLLKLKSNPKWAQYALGSVSSILYAFGDRELGFDIDGQLGIQVEAHARESWMEGWTEGWTEGWNSGDDVGSNNHGPMRNWWKAIGLEDVIAIGQVTVLR